MRLLQNLEQGKGNPRPETMNVIKATFEQFGIEFINNHGVDLRSERFDVQIFHGADAHMQVIQDYEKTLGQQEEGGAR